MNPITGLLRAGAAFLFGLLLAAAVPSVGNALTFTVNSTADVAAPIPVAAGVCNSASGTCTLRAAIQAANATPGADTINLPAGTYLLTLVGAGEQAAATGDLDISVLGGQLTINGAGAATTIIDGGGIDRVFETTLNGTNALISGVTIRNGLSSDGLGGCVSVGGNTTMTLNDAVVTACTATAGGGGGIDVTGTLNMTNVAVTNNTSASGGIDNGVAGTITWTNGILSGNSDRGINNSGTLALTNVTISGNSTVGDGAGLDNDGTATLTNCTITGNTAPVNVPATNIGGIRATTAVSVRNTIIANNTPTNCGAGANATPLSSLGNNLDSGTSCLAVVAAGDLTNTDPLLGALALNGGALQTHALLTGSPAIDAGSATVFPGTDARGIARPVDGNPVPPAITPISDIGAFEFRPQKITVTLPPPFDFTTVTSGTTADHIITLANAGDGALVLGTIAVTDPLAAPFSIPANTCSGQTLALGVSCTFTTRFSPTAAVLSTDTFDIPSNDPLTPAVSFSLSGTGTNVPVPLISVTDSIAPANDQLVPFGGVTLGSSADATITITNTGTANLVIGTIASADPLAAPFSILNNTCSGQTIAPAATCTLTVHFAPTVNGAASDTFDIPSNVAGASSLTMTVNGTGGTATPGTVNNPPTNPVLVSPANGQTGIGTSVLLTWNKSADPDGDTVSYQVVNCTNQDFSGCTPLDVPATASVVQKAGLGALGVGIILIGFVARSGARRTRRSLLVITVLLLTGGLFTACGGGGGGTPANPTPTPTTEQVSFTVSGLTPATTYFWKVIASDGKGGQSSSEIRSFVTQ